MGGGRFYLLYILLKNLISWSEIEFPWTFWIQTETRLNNFAIPVDFIRISNWISHKNLWFTANLISGWKIVQFEYKSANKISFLFNFRQWISNVRFAESQPLDFILERLPAKVVRYVTYNYHFKMLKFKWTFFLFLVFNSFLLIIHQKAKCFDFFIKNPIKLPENQLLCENFQCQIPCKTIYLYVQS